MKIIKGVIQITIIKDFYHGVKNYVTGQSPSVNDKALITFLGLDKYATKDAIRDATYITCLKMLGETLGKLSLKLYQHTDNGVIKRDDFNNVLLRPNPNTTPTIFWSTVEYNRNHYGNAYVYCEKSNTGELKNLWILPSSDVTILYDNAGLFLEKGRLWYKYKDSYTNEEYIFNSDEVLHFKTSHTYDGIVGKSIKDILADSITGNIAGQEFMNTLYQNGMTASAVVQYTGELSEEKEKIMLKKIKKATTGTKNAGGLFALPTGTQIVPINLKLTDSQFFELRKYSALQIAAAMGIKPNHINNYEKSSYANSEIQNLTFYVDTMLFIIKQYEEETTYKLLTDSKIKDNCYFRFNEKALLRTDSKTQAEILRGFVRDSIYTSNDARDILEMEHNEYGDKLYANGNIVPLELAGAAYMKNINTEGGEK